ncbi:MAG: cytochrome c-type biogenesis protein [Ardenticatenaceae bacterium]
MKRPDSVAGASALLGLVSLLMLLLPLRAAAQGPQDAPTVNDVAQDLYCPLCAGLTVDVCELEVCDDMRAVIADKLAAGESPEQIRAYFVEQYGQKVLGRPAMEGFHLAAWIMPFVALAAAGLVLFGWLRSRAAAPMTSRAVAQPTPADDYAARLERELQRLEE